MSLHFSAQEYEGRRTRACAALRERGLDGILCFAPESLYYLTGHDSFGFCFFQCLYMDASGETTLLARSADLRQAQHTSDIRDIRIWRDGEDAQPARDLRDMLASRGAQGKKLGIERDTHGLTAVNYIATVAALEGFCKLEEADRLVSRLRLTKSPAEMECVRTAAGLADAALDAGLQATGAGACEGEILAAMQGEIFRGDGDYPGNEFIIGSGPDALLCRYKSGRRRLDAQDQLTLEFAGAHRHYHAAMMRTIVVGEPDGVHTAMHAAAVEALEACEEVLRPGRVTGDVFAAHARVLEKHGHAANSLAACGYSMGARFSPSWMDWPMFYEGGGVELRGDMVFFIHIIIADSVREKAMSVGHSLRVREDSAVPPERLSRHGTELLSRQGPPQSKGA